MSRLGIDEFADAFPEHWVGVRALPFCALWRAPFDRLLSGVHHYCKAHATRVLRFLPPDDQRRLIFKTIERLERVGCAKKTLGQANLTVVRPQCVYCSSAHTGIDIRFYSLGRVEEMDVDLEAVMGCTLDRPKINSGESFDLLPVLGRLLALRQVVSFLRRILGAAAPKRYLCCSGGGPSFGLSDTDADAIYAFVRRFFEEDFRRLPGADQPL